MMALLIGHRRQRISPESCASANIQTIRNAAGTAMFPMQRNELIIVTFQTSHLTT